MSLLQDYVAEVEVIKNPQTIEVEGELDWEIERILYYRKKYNSSTLQYLVKYLGYDISDAIWLEEHDLNNTPYVLKDYKAT